MDRGGGSRVDRRARPRRRPRAPGRCRAAVRRAARQGENGCRRRSTMERAAIARRGSRCAPVQESANSARDLERLFPLVAKGSTTIAHCGVAAPFRPAGSAEIEAFKRQHGLTKPYILTVGERLGVSRYKNGFLLFRAVSLLPDPTQFTVVCVGGTEEIEAPLGALVPGTDVRRLKLDDDALRAAYSGAHAYLCSSRYEGFGMPVVEAMACGCPVVACRTSSIPEVAGCGAVRRRGRHGGSGKGVAEPQRQHVTGKLHTVRVQRNECHITDILLGLYATSARLSLLSTPP